MADCDKDQECEKIVPEPIKPEPLPKQCSGGGDESGSGTNDFNELENRPKYGGRKMTGETDIPDLSSTIEQLSGEINIKTPMITNYDGEVGENVTHIAPGDRVKHPAFGIGDVISAKQMGSDILYEVVFENVGTKKLMATYAKLTKA